MEVVTKKLNFFQNSIKDLPPSLKLHILRKFLLTAPMENFNDILYNIIHPQIAKIDLSSIIIDDNTLKILSICINLKEITLRNTCKEKLSAEGLKYLFSKLTKLVILDVCYCEEFNDDVLDCLCNNCKHIRELHARSCNITNKGLLSSSLNNLKCLDFSKTKITGEGIRTFFTNRTYNLKELRLDECFGLDDDTLKIVIESCPEIEILTFYNCAISDEMAVFHEIMQNCKKLKQLHWTVPW